MRNLVTVDEVFALAVQVEENGAAFYRCAAELVADLHAKKLLLELVAVEEEHKATFSKMRKGFSRLAADAKGDLLADGSAYLSAIAAGYAVEGSPSVAAKLTGSETVFAILAAAIELEKQAVLLYVGIRDIVSGAAAKAQIDAIVREEARHVAALAAEQARLAT